ncbi:hypothetical protein OOT46_20090 [Aquabacterium sp. A7-Y]|uniref:hypothetical protein n=1 Tax=Aquabacterium sp. A7-Y TaxID=1349605 RepID=UPI00223DFF1F|nr:hypothetical protein [Aquabacterium sp. A7-Y]MCW7540138.1 hypothetical protein [Aquabacterium sp. A7-Y]
MKIRYLGLLWVAALAALLSACAGPSLAPPAEAGALAGKAVVILSATHSEDAGSWADVSFFFDRSKPETRTTLHSKETALTIPLPSDFDDLYGRVYVLTLPPGQHQIDAWNVVGGRTQSFVTPQPPPPPLSFEVSAGEVLYLGNLHMNIRMASVGLGGWAPVDGYPEVRDRRELDIAVAEKKHPVLQGKVSTRLLPLGPWLSEEARTERRVEPRVIPVVPPLRK